MNGRNRLDFSRISPTRYSKNDIGFCLDIGILFKIISKFCFKFFSVFTAFY